MFKREFNINIKEKLIRKNKTYKILNELIINVMEIDDV